MDGTADSPYGGQTGSLLPGGERAFSRPCWLPGSDAEINVVEGDTAFVAYPGRAGAGQATLTDADGNPVPLSFEASEGSSALLARTQAALTAGEYSLAYECDAGTGQPSTQRARVVVTPAMSLPTQVGELEAPAPAAPSESCDSGPWLPFIWYVDEALVPYMDLLAVNVAIGDQAPAPLAELGRLELDDASVVIELPRCTIAASPCIHQGELEIVLSVAIAGETQQPDPARVVFDGTCRNRPPQNEELSCSVHTGGGASPAKAWVLGLAALGWLARRRWFARRR